ncbi:MAG: polyprenyl synthetase family protein [Bacteroidales bacterium]|nr:polyprenyl synthetase family protein [Bacteroidales bacterium]
MIDEIRKPILKHMEDFEPFFREQLHSPNKLLAIVTHYILRRGGKKMRPMLVFLSALQSGGVTKSSNIAAALIELLHTATLVHDDVVDESEERRGQKSVNALWNSKVAVLVGDFFLARGLQMATENGELAILKTVSDAVQEISEGEIEQMEHARKLDIKEETYYEVIRKKTATLIAACTKCGAISAGAREETIQAMYEYGLNLGIAFQIKDDIFDYQKSSLLGKPTGNDIKERKLTLPLLYALRTAPKDKSKEMMKMIRSKYKESKTAKEATEFVQQYGGIEYSVKKMKEYGNMAVEALHRLPINEATPCLEKLILFNEQRKK